MYKVVTASETAKITLPNLEREIAAYNRERQERFIDFGGASDCYYRVQEETDSRYGTSYVITFVDPDEEFTSMLWENPRLESWMDKFTDAVKKDTGDSDFLFEPYSYGGPFIGRAWPNWVYRD